MGFQALDHLLEYLVLFFQHTNTLKRVKDKHISLLRDDSSIFEAVDKFLDSRKNDLFRYADLTKDDVGRSEEILFLASNLPYLWVGALRGGTKGAILNLAGVVSFIYHYFQLTLGPNRSEVRRCLLVDYVTAVNACVVYGLDAVDIFLAFQSPTSGVVFLTGSISILALFRSSIADGKGYIFWHSIWHLCGAMTAYLVNNY